MIERYSRKEIKKIWDEKNKYQIWLDIEIESADYLQDLQLRIDRLIENLPIEVLLVRRSRKSRNLMATNQKKITLNELSLSDVFNARMEQEPWETDEELTRKERMTVLFEQAVDQVKSNDDSNELEKNGAKS